MGEAVFWLKSLYQLGFVCFFDFYFWIREYVYLLTPQGISEKSKLTIHFLQRKTEEYERLKIEIEQLKQQIG